MAAVSPPPARREAESEPIPSPPVPRFRTVLLAGLAAFLSLATAPRLGAQEFRLGDDDLWAEKLDDPEGERAQLRAARAALERGEAGRARNLVNRFLELRPLSPLRAEALLIRGDSIQALGDEYESLFDYEEICRKYPGSEVFVTALERELEIGTLYANGKRRKLWGLFRIVDASDDAQEILIRVQERLPGSELAERAGLVLSDYYFRVGELDLAATSYELFLENYPRSPEYTKARLRLIYSNIAAFKGPEYDARGLTEARLRLRDLQTLDPALAQQVGAEAILVRIYESEANKMLATANWYWQSGDPISAEMFLRRLVQLYPDATAALEALRVIPRVLERVPENVVRNGPDWRALRAARLEIPWEEATVPAGVASRTRERLAAEASEAATVPVGAGPAPAVPDRRGNIADGAPEPPTGRGPPP
jgi:outer membrane protein assembly factor BamD (BamD/ComL family)